MKMKAEDRDYGEDSGRLVHARVGPCPSLAGLALLCSVKPCHCM